MDNFPLLFGRTGGAPIQCLDVLSPKIISNELSELLAYSKSLNSEKKEIVELLHLIIEREDNEKQRNILINFKRDIIKSRKFKKYQQIAKLYPILNNKLGLYETLLNDFNNFKDKYVELYNQTLFNSIRNFKNLTNSYFLKNGLLFSSRVLYQENTKSNFSYTSLNKKSKRLILSNLKYFTRSITKTTPFSSFNNLFCFEIVGEYFVPINSPLKKSNFMISNLFFYYLKKTLISNHIFRSNLLIKSNSTIKDISPLEEKFHFFVNFENNESFKNINKSLVLYDIINDLKSDCDYLNLTQKLSAKYQENIDAAKLFVDKLIDEGFLILCYPVSNNDVNWLHKLLVFTENLQLNNFSSLLKDILETKINLETNLDTNIRYLLIQKCYNKIIYFFDSLDHNSFFSKKVQEHDLFFEDCFATSEYSIPVKSIETISLNLQKVFKTLNIIPLRIIYRKRLSQLLIDNKISHIGILDFYENYYGKFKETLVLDEIHLQASDRVLQQIFQNDKDQKYSLYDEINLIDFYEIDTEIITNNKSFGVYFQAVDENFEKIVVNSFTNGSGTNISRFLNFLPEKYANEIINFNNKSFPERIVAEIKDASIHNANIFPQLAKQIISSTEDFATAANFNTIPLLELYVRTDSERGLILCNKDGYEINPINFSLEGLKRRSKFTQFLDIFNETDIFGYVYILQSINEYFEKKLDTLKCLVLPRIVFGEKIILQRKKWLIKKSEFAFVFENKNDAAETHFLLNDFIAKNAIDSQIFLNIGKKESLPDLNDNYKPQFIDFNSPVSVLLFANVITKAIDIIELTEVFPNFRNATGGENFVKEYILNLH